ncbi:MAG TPA: cysteine--tRNA ligase [Gemmatimonadaceae bacterium]|nr:cysteine--tRNA ligase [Gemmatimonadaceae bacterium]
MSDFVLYNTLTRRKEPFEPADGSTVRMYTCGPTVYNPAHLGNFRTFLFEDLLRRTLQLRGWKVHQVMNLTDVDDKIIARASERGVTIGEVTEPVSEIFQRDREFLRIQRAEDYPRATEHIPEMIELVQALEERGLAYKAEDNSVYFAISRFPSYGKLSRLDVRSIRPGARVAADDYNKEDVRDFALWKAAKPEDEATGAAWDSPWGRGRPGWHLECSAMAKCYLGETLDIHAGGADLIFPHHEDEIAQSEGANDVPFSRFWCHGEFLLTEGVKMAKRLGNVANIQSLREAGVSAAAIRHFVFSVHYRKQLNLTEEALEASQAAVRRVGAFAERLASATGGTPGLAEAAQVLERDAKAALFDDLNAPEALGALFEFIRRANAELDSATEGSDLEALARARSAFELVNGVLDIVPDESEVGDELGAWVEERIGARAEARRRRDFAAADAIRKELEERGIAIEDTPQGTRWKKVL